ncbi:orotidine-5'-phosphate decarboxylase [Candidatus Nomurabacteria bacterium]|jgi:orotidine-5'-phosphate decarboxylase|nr:MAG: orotidine-5'-phosphate decarboxylase [Candidatus Nomurabacteria bacterium]
MESKFSQKQLDAARKKIIFALDVDDLKKAKNIINDLGPHVGGIKIGLETQTVFGGPIMLDLTEKQDVDTFYDGKFNDIPATIIGATKPLAKRGVGMFNIHATSGNEAIKAAVKACESAGCIVLVVTVLTSISPEECMEIFGDTPENKVLQFARKAKANGAHGVVCSAKELPVLMADEETHSLIKVTPGIQPEWMQKNDQQRVMTPYEAIKAGADYLVIGRAISQPPKDHEYIQGDSLKAIELITEEIAKALSEMNIE